ncbi:MAG: RdgB/HAM1 family non-canonical purine NTP pyrophosphatase [Bacteroidetes bacterium]|jgi:XTP/dITP diphosphohydrolase|nr:RdgB/HAM1 family non-canonical purine NTP pyrophosphatase [Bacteroidota bacterium]
MFNTTRQLIFATNNQHKANEINAILGTAFKVCTLREAGIEIDIPEPHATLEENAREKSSTIYRLTARDCFSEDTGLEVEALGGAPGVKSARYAGEHCNTDDNIDKLLTELANQENRKARFRTVISLIENGTEKQFEGICEGAIDWKKNGEQGFGYDPIFIPSGATNSFATMSMDEKNKYSHRKKAVEKLIAYLQQKK